MNLWQFISEVTSRRRASATEKMVARVADSISLTTTRDNQGGWCLIADSQSTYRVSLHLWAEETRVHFMAASQVVVERDLLPRELLLTLLEENHRFIDGAYQLVAKDSDRYVVLGRVVEARRFSEAELSKIGKSLIGRMQRMITTLYARELIISGPESQKGLK